MNSNLITLQEALKRTNRASECCIHCQAPLFYDIDGVYVEDRPDIIKITSTHDIPRHLKWLIDGVTVFDKIHYRTVCWNCIYKAIREAYHTQHWRKMYVRGWIKEVVAGNDVLPPTRMFVIGRRILPLIFTDLSAEEIQELSKKHDTASLESFIRRYGEIEGPSRYEDYVSFHTVKNTYEWKRDHKGWTKEQFDEFNRSRATTRENLIQRYGEQEGVERFNAYCSWQAYAGCALAYFKSIYGETEGERKYLEINQKKRHDVETFQARYGKELGYEKWRQWHEQAARHGSEVIRNILSRPYSKVSQQLFSDILSQLSPEEQAECRFATHGGEVRITLADRACWFDFVLGQKVIEFQGDYWHRNPQLYVGDLVTEDVKSIWKHDEERVIELKALGYEILVIWELDYAKDPARVLQRCLAFLHDNSNLQ